MTNYIKYSAIVAAVAAIYLVGYKHAESEGELAIEELKLNHALAILAAQKEEKAKYETDIANLLSDLDRARSERDSRLYELESFRSRETDYRTCRRQRDSLARIAVGLEDVASRAILFIEGGTK